ncbi:uncharacterized protein Triagg1_7445 [Trichoderma aggressivum f. europaeum]|uniref:Uncharacterized protein n=1 Tax=Trichoderma aggressivum f. europaeum TaxID=173218 RepID=A0AAE1M2R3_9HYPO|nr:hypothetical protein Triagg1_7445 [Trichoderma aggressivum f. europaeum]
MTPVWRFLAFQSSDLRPNALELQYDARSELLEEIKINMKTAHSCLYLHYIVILREAVLSYDHLAVDNTSMLEQRGSLASSFAQAIQASQDHGVIKVAQYLDATKLLHASASAAALCAVAGAPQLCTPPWRRAAPASTCSVPADQLPSLQPLPDAGCPASQGCLIGCPDPLKRPAGKHVRNASRRT